MSDLFFLPGAGGSASFWRPVADRLTIRRRKHFFSWPGLGDEPADPAIQSLDDLVGMVLTRLEGLEQPADIVAQSMGGVIALRAALAAPERVGRLVLSATSAGLAMQDLGAEDWRPNYRGAYPGAASWASAPIADLSPLLPGVTQPCLLLWGGADPISPPAVGRRLAELLAHASLRVIEEADHGLALTHASLVAGAIEAHLAEPVTPL